jgi:hypothetical protein
MILLDTHAILWLLGGHRRAESLIASGEVELRAYQRGRTAQLRTGVFRAFRMASPIPGVERRNKVSSIAA